MSIKKEESSKFLPAMFLDGFYELLKKYETLPAIEEHVAITKDKKVYRIRLEIEEEEPATFTRPTHDSVALLVQFIKENRGEWFPANDMANNPPLLQFVKQGEKHRPPLTCSTTLSGLCHAKEQDLVFIKNIQSKGKLL